MKRVVFILAIVIGLANYSFSPTNPYSEKQMNAELERIEEERLKEKRVVELLEAIKIIESSNNYSARGGSGEYGAYQFMPRTWEMYSLKFFDEVLDITCSKNQDKVARAKIEGLIKQGYSNKEIASIWNSGRPQWQGKIGVNSFGVKYNVPRYVDNFINTLNMV